MATYDYGFGKVYLKLVKLTQSGTYKVKQPDGSIVEYKKWVIDDTNTVPFDTNGVIGSVSIDISVDDTRLEGAISEPIKGAPAGSILGMTLLPKDIMPTNLQYNVTIELIGAKTSNADFQKIFDMVEDGWYIDMELYPIKTAGTGDEAILKVNSPTEIVYDVDTDSDGVNDAVDGSKITSYQFAVKVTSYNPSLNPKDYPKVTINGSLIPLRREEA